MRHAQCSIGRNRYVRLNSYTLPAASRARIELTKNRDEENESVSDRRFLIAIAAARRFFTDYLRAFSLLQDKRKGLGGRAGFATRQDIQISVRKPLSRNFAQRPVSYGDVTVTMI